MVSSLFPGWGAVTTRRLVIRTNIENAFAAMVATDIKNARATMRVGARVIARLAPQPARAVVLAAYCLVAIDDSWVFESQTQRVRNWFVTEQRERIGYAMVRMVHTIFIFVIAVLLGLAISACRDIDQPPPEPVLDPNAPIDGGAEGGMASTPISNYADAYPS